MHSTEGSAEQDSDRLGPEFAHLTDKVVGRAREEAEDILAEAQSLRQEEPSVARRTAVYGLADFLKAAISLARARVWWQPKRGPSKPALALSARSQDASGSQEVTGSPAETAGDGPQTASVDRPPSS
jgi:cell division septum initiation protein DivIVA